MVQLRTISFDEVKKHNTSSSCWIVIHDKVYDVTSFLREHPGGEEILLDNTAKYATNAFEDVGHSTDAREMLAGYLIGEIAEKEPASSLNPYDDPDAKSLGSGTNALGFLLPLAAIAVGLLVFTVYKRRAG